MGVRIFGGGGGGGSTSFAAPTGLVGLTAVPGVAVTAMRSDGAPALDQSINPTWLGTHTFDQSGGAGLFISEALSPFIVFTQTSLSHSGTLLCAAMSANRQWTLPNLTGTIALLSQTVQVGTGADPAGAGAMSIVNRTGLTGAGGNIAAPVILANSVGAGMYVVAIQMACTTARNVGNTTSAPVFNLSWTAGGGSKTKLICGPLDMSATTSTAQVSFSVYISSGNITWGTSGFTTTGGDGGTWELRMRCSYWGA